MINVFVSRPTWVSNVYVRGLQGFLLRLTDYIMQPRTLGASDYPNRAPLDEVINLLDQCEGAVILGYPQIEIRDGMIKGQPVSGVVHLATEWNHIEAGLAYARGLPLLVIHHVGVCRGIFDRGATNTFLYEKDLSDPAWSVTPEISGALNKWREQVVKGDRLSVGQEKQDIISEPACPNCSTSGKKFYLSRLPIDFAAAFAATHHCAKCDSTFTFP
jgi:hypothetical protein